MDNSNSPIPEGKIPTGLAKTATQARQGVTTGKVRWILAISLGLAIVAMVVVFLLAGHHPAAT